MCNKILFNILVLITAAIPLTFVIYTIYVVIVDEYKWYRKSREYRNKDSKKWGWRV